MGPSARPAAGTAARAIEAGIKVSFTSACPYYAMRRLLLLLLLLPGCAKVAPPWIVAEAASVVVFGRGVEDIVVSAVTGRDCSIVRLDRGQTYCAPPEAAPPRPPVCTRSLGVPDCWANPQAFAVPPRGIADQPGLTPLQEEYRRAPWPKSLNVGL